MVGNFIEAIVRDARDHNSLSGGRGNVYIVHANAKAADDAAATELRDHLAGDFGVGGENRVGVFGDLEDGVRLGFGREVQVRVDLRQHLASRIQVRKNRVRNGNQCASHLIS